MKWEKYKQLTKEQKEEYKYKFDKTQNLTIFAIQSGVMLITGTIMGVGGIISKNAILISASNLMGDLMIAYGIGTVIGHIILRIKIKKWIKKLNLK